jgi:hypothetical protein
MYFIEIPFSVLQRNYQSLTPLRLWVSAAAPTLMALIELYYIADFLAKDHKKQLSLF